jgi:hypothetical protein
VVNTGQAAGTTTINKPWTSTWIFGLVEAKPIDVRSDCPGGVALVETQMTFVNGVATVLTLGIWVPRTVTITCAGAAATLPASARVLAADASTARTFSAALHEAVRIADAADTPVYLIWAAAPAHSVTQ